MYCSQDGDTVLIGCCRWYTCCFISLGMGIASLVVSLVVRFLATYLAALGNELNLKERLFIAMAWLPKATVQVGKWEDVGVW